jgi:spore coat protein U-like protein
MEGCFIMIYRKMTSRVLGIAVGVIAASGGAISADAQTASGTIGVSLNILAACAVNGGNSSGTMGRIGTIAFADQSGVFANADATMVAQGAMNAVTVLCTPGLAPKVTVGAGANDAGNVRQLAYLGQTVAYRLYMDSARQDEITIGRQISLGTAATSALTLPIYARASSNGLALPAGTYTDTVQVTLSW